MVFIWKKFLETINVPNIIFHDTLITLFKDKLSCYDEDTDTFANVTSARLPIVSSFLNFWDENMSEEHDEPEIEIDEISTLFKKWSGKTFASVEDQFLIELIRHFYSEIIVIDDKYVVNIKCKLWDKRQEVIDALDLLKNVKGDNYEPQSIDSIYADYVSKTSKPCVVSKQCFEKISKEYLGDNLDSDGLITPWWS